jgi:hypothetical protein
MTISMTNTRSQQPLSARHLVRAGLLAALAVVLTLAMLPRMQATRGAAQSQSLLRVHHHHGKRHERIAALSEIGRQTSDAGPSHSLTAPCERAFAGRHAGSNMAPRAPPFRV